MKSQEHSDIDQTQARTTRLNLNLSAKTRAELDLIAKKAGCTITELVRFGLAIVKLYYSSSEDEELAMVKKDGSRRTVIPPWA